MWQQCQPCVCATGAIVQTTSHSLLIAVQARASFLAKAVLLKRKSGRGLKCFLQNFLTLQSFLQLQQNCCYCRLLQCSDRASNNSQCLMKRWGQDARKNIDLAAANRWPLIHRSVPYSSTSFQDFSAPRQTAKVC